MEKHPFKETQREGGEITHVLVTFLNDMHSHYIRCVVNSDTEIVMLKIKNRCVFVQELQVNIDRSEQFHFLAAISDHIESCK